MKPPVRIAILLTLLPAPGLPGAENEPAPDRPETVDPSQPKPNLRARYLPLTADHDKPAPFGSVDFVTGPAETNGGQPAFWWQLELRDAPDPNPPPTMVLRALTRRPPFSRRGDSPGFLRYLLRIPDLGETLEYRDAVTGRALLPAWGGFERDFVPRPASATRFQQAFAETGELLGHVLTLVDVSPGEGWSDWADVRLLRLNRELLVGTGRNFKDQEGRRLPQTPERQNYTYIPFERADYQTMFEAGLNLFTVDPRQEAWVRAEPVFYLRRAEGKPPLRYPADLYRANYCGPVMFMDEPSILMVGDRRIHNTLRYFSDAATLIEKRTRATYLSDGGYGAFALEKALRSRGVSFGDMRLMQSDYPSWETLYETTFYQMKGGGAGLVHEGRYQLEAFDRAVERFTGRPRRHTATELLRYHYAVLRGGTRPFGKHWGTAIYGQCDPAIAPEAVRMAWDLGARYVWFWTSDHDHHVPWPEQLALARALKAHAQSHPRPSIFGPAPERDAAIVIPDGFFLSLENLWWVRAMDQDGKNEASRAYRRLMRRALLAAQECLDRGEDFDLTVDDGRPIRGYRRLVRVNDAE